MGFHCEKHLGQAVSTILARGMVTDMRIKKLQPHERQSSCSECGSAAAQYSVAYITS